MGCISRLLLFFLGIATSLLGGWLISLGVEIGISIWFLGMVFIYISFTSSYEEKPKRKDYEEKPKKRGISASKAYAIFQIVKYFIK